MTESKIIKKLDNEVKTFKNLETDIIKTNLCCACGACIAHCESQNFDLIEMTEYYPKFKKNKDMKDCMECGICYNICPQTPSLLEELNNIHCVEDNLGNIIKIIAAKSIDPSIKKKGQDGGIVSSILTYLFNKNKIDAAIISGFDKNFKPIPKIIFDKDEILSSAGTRYSISPQLLPLKDIYNISHKILEEKNIFDIDQLRLAFIGTPCQSKAVRKMKYLYVKPAHIIKYIISVFCFENFDYSKLFDIIKKETKIDPINIRKTWIKKNFFIKTKSNQEFEVNIKLLNPAVRTHCHECNDFTGVFSDISIGASGAPKRYSIVIVRTEIGEKEVNAMLSNSLIEQYIIPADCNYDWKSKQLNWLKKIISLKGK